MCQVVEVVSWNSEVGDRPGGQPVQGHGQPRRMRCFLGSDALHWTLSIDEIDMMQSSAPLRS
jgi:hypothetical protein